ncbi:MAG: hypothetical protein ABSG13_03715 [Bryobacteraceae bacterium]|jgi:hypothetical protein
MRYDLPVSTVFNYYQPEDPDASGGQIMEFRLIYQGPLPAEKCEDRGSQGGTVGRAKEKHQLRKHFHLQLRELWRQNPDLKRQAETSFTVITTPPNMVSYPGPGVRMIYPSQMGMTGEQQSRAKTWVEHIADDHKRCGGRFVPLVSELGGFTCDLNILFLRRDNPGNLVSNGGDIDNRIKVLFDGLRMPKTERELGGFGIDADEDPFFCLLEDDTLITRVSVTTDRLIIPQKDAENVNDVLLVIHVTMVNPSAVFAGDRLI